MDCKNWKGLIMSESLSIFLMSIPCFFYWAPTIPLSSNSNPIEANRSNTCNLDAIWTIHKQDTQPQTWRLYRRRVLLHTSPSPCPLVCRSCTYLPFIWHTGHWPIIKFIYSPQEHVNAKLYWSGTLQCHWYIVLASIFILNCFCKSPVWQASHSPFCGVSKTTKLSI